MWHHWFMHGSFYSVRYLNKSYYSHYFWWHFFPLHKKHGLPVFIFTINRYSFGIFSNLVSVTQTFINKLYSYKYERTCSKFWRNIIHFTILSIFWQLNFHPSQKEGRKQGWNGSQNPVSQKLQDTSNFYSAPGYS